MADVIDALSFEAGSEGRCYINYRDLSVQQLGSIYERLLEHEIAREEDEIVVRPNVFARKGSGSYYTPDELVSLILEETIGPLVRVRLEAFATEAEKLRKSRRRLRLRLTELKHLDPASKLLDLKVCDPAMGSGHFLVGFVDYLADRVSAAMAEAEDALEGYVSPLVEDIDTVRDTVLRNADTQGWTIQPEQLDDRHVVRRMVLKRCVYGVDKNPMAVELAKVSLWLHTFTVGAPLGFLDHHLRCGDSLFGCRVRQGIDRAEEGGRLFLHQPLNWAMQATRSMQVVEMLSDAEIDEAHQSAGVFSTVRQQTAPLDAFLSLVHAFEWLNTTDEDDEAALQAYLTGALFHMTNDSHLFRTREELEEQEGAWPIGDNRFDSSAGVWVPLYEGKMVQAFDHRAASIVIKRENLHRPAQPEPAMPEQHGDPNWLPRPQYWVAATECGWEAESGWVLGFKEVTAPTNVRTFIAALLPAVGFGNKVPILRPETVVGRAASGNDESARIWDDARSARRSDPSPSDDSQASITRMHPERREWLLVGNLNATVFDFVTRQKVQGQTLNLFIVEQLPVVPPERYERVCFGPKTAAEIVREAVLELTYTANDMAPFARDIGYVDEAGAVKPPFRWDEERRLRLRAKLDAVFFHLYGVTDRDDVRHVYSTFPIVERQETSEYGRFRSRDLCLAYLNALSAGRPDAEPDL